MTTKDLEGRFGSEVGDTTTICQYSHSVDETCVRWPLMLKHVFPYHVPDVFNGVKVWTHSWPWHSIDVVLLEVSIDDSCTGIVVLKNKMSTNTPSKLDDKGC